MSFINLASMRQPSMPTASPGKQESRLHTSGTLLGSMEEWRRPRFWKLATLDSSSSHATMSLNPHVYDRHLRGFRRMNRTPMRHYAKCTVDVGKAWRFQWDRKRASGGQPCRVLRHQTQTLTQLAPAQPSSAPSGKPETGKWE